MGNPSTASPCHLFLHLPKTAGTTLHFILSREYRGQPSLWTQSHRETVERLDAMSPSGRAALRLVRGHYHHGIHERLPGPVLYFTMLRDPVARFVSYYHHVIHEARTHPGRQGWWTRLGKSEPTLEDFATEVRDRENDNGMARRITGIEARHGELPADTAVRAVAILDKEFRFVGLTERFDESVLAMRRVLGWRTYPFYVAQKRHGADNRPALSEDVRRLIEARNTHDLVIHQWVRERFDQWLGDLGVPASGELRRFRRLNTVATPLISMGLAVRRRLRRG